MASSHPSGWGAGCLAELCLYTGFGAGVLIGGVTGEFEESLLGGLLAGCILAALVIVLAIRSGQRER